MSKDGVGEGPPRENKTKRKPKGLFQRKLFLVGVRTKKKTCVSVLVNKGASRSIAWYVF